MRIAISRKILKHAHEQIQFFFLHQEGTKATVNERIELDICPLPVLALFHGQGPAGLEPRRVSAPQG